MSRPSLADKLVVAISSRALFDLSESHRLFVERGAAAAPGFALDGDNAADVARICARLDGLPLAIELAAAQVRLLPPSAILARISDRIDSVGSRKQDLPARQRTLRGAVTWSYNTSTQTNPGTGTHTVTCVLDGVTRNASASFSVP